MNDAAVLSATATLAAAALVTPLPPPVEERLKSLLLEGLSWMVMGTRHTEGERLLARWRTTSAGTCSAAGCPVRLPVAEAARLNTSLCQIYDCNDGRRMAWVHGGLWHPGRYIIPAALALAEHHQLPGTCLLRLMALGYDIGGKTRTTPNEIAGAHAIAAMTAAAAAAPIDIIRHAIVLGHFSFPLPPRWPDDGDLNHLKYGFIVRAAMQAAQEAQEGACLPAAQCTASLREPFYLDRPDDADAYECMHVYIKPYTVCRSLHGAVALALEARREDGLRDQDIARMELVVGNAGDPLPQPYRRGSHYKFAQFSIPYAVACAVIDGEVGHRQFDQIHLDSDAIHDLQARIQVTQAEQFGTATAGWREPAQMRITTRDGLEIVRRLDAPPGSILAPLNTTELRAKFARWTDGAFSTDQQEQAIRLTTIIDHLPSVDPLVDLLRQVRPLVG